MKTATNKGCPECGKRFIFFNDDQYFYGSPVRTCKKCGNYYIDKRYHEIAIEGFRSGQLSCIGYSIACAVGIFFLWRGIHLTRYKLIGNMKPMEKILPVIFIITGIAIVLIGIFEIIMILTGKKTEKLDKLKLESEMRLKNKVYAQLLKQEGYNVPKQFL